MMGLNDVVDALERAEQLLKDGDTGPTGLTLLAAG